MSIFFPALWAALCAFGATRLFIFIGVEFNLYDISEMILLGVSVKSIIFFSIFLLFWITGISKLFGNIILTIIGWAGLIICVGLIITIAYWVLSWLCGLL